MKYKKTIIVLISILMIFCLSGCRSKDYKLATKLFEEGDYKRAESFFETARKFKDSIEKTKECKYYVAKETIASGNYEEAALYLADLDYLDSLDLLKNVNMHLNKDYSFLEDLESLLTYRLHEAAQAKVEAKVLFKTEYDALKQYELAIFYDTDLKQISNDIINGLKEYSSTYENPILCEAQYHIYNAQALISNAYSKLYNQYDFMIDDEEFVKTYINTKDSYDQLATASAKIKADLDSQGTLLANTGTPWTKSKDKLTWKITNNTEYTYTLKMLVTYYDDSGSSYFTDQAQAKLTPGSSQEFKFKINNDLFNSVTYDYVYQDIF